MLPEPTPPKASPIPLPIVGSYQLLQPLGSGGMSSVFRAVHLENGLEVAVKVLPRSLAKNPVTLQRFLREARSAESLEHPGVVAIYDRGVDQGRHYLVLEYMAGGDLHDKVKLKGPLSIAEAIEVTKVVSDGLRYAASRGVIHRDIKPANLLLCSDDRVKIADLGLALQADDEDERVTREGTTVGTVDYMAPEQARDSRGTSIRSDIYSLGCTLYFLLTGEPPYAGGDVAEKLTRHITAPPPDVRDRRPEVPERFARIIKAMMAKRPEGRFTDYDDLLKALDSVPITATKGATPSTVEPPLVALIDVEDEDDEIALAPLGDEDDEPLLLTEAKPSKVSRGTPRSKPDDGPELRLDDLKALDDVPKRSSRPTAAGGTGRTLTRGGQRKPAARPEALFVEDQDDDEEGVIELDEAEEELAHGLPAAEARTSSPKMTSSERDFLMKCVLLGLGLVFSVVVVDQLIRGDWSGESSLVELSDEELLDQAVVGGVEAPVIEPRAELDLSSAVVPRPATPDVPPTPPVALSAVPKPKQVVTVVEPPWVEPVDPVGPLVSDPETPPAVEAQYLPDWVRTSTVTQGPVRRVVLRRVPDPRDPEQRGSLKSAAEVSGALVEVADNGPFFEEGFRVVGESRVIRARSGFRPIVALGRSISSVSGRGSALLDLGSKEIVLEGLDLILNVDDLPATCTTLFAIKGGSLTFRDCSVTVLNAKGLPFSLVRTMSAKDPSRVHFDRSFVRGAFGSIVEMSGGPVDIAVVDSAWINGKARGSGLSFTPPVAPAGTLRQISLVRSLLVGFGPMLERTDTLPNQQPSPVSVRALGCTFAHFQSPHPSTLFTAGNNQGAAGELLLWKGDANRFDGFGAWVTAGTAREVRVPDLSAARTVWTGTDPSSETEPAQWPLIPPSPDRVHPDQLREHAPGRFALIDRLPIPSPWIHENTITTFPTPVVPGVESLFGPPVAPALAGMGGSPGGLPGGRIRGAVGMLSPAAAEQARRAEMPGSNPTATLSGQIGGADPGILEFDTEAIANGRDLGLFLASQLREGSGFVRVKVRGRGQHPWTPVRVPAGVSLEIRVTPGLDGFVPSWEGVPGAESNALLEVVGGHLVLDGLVLSTDGAPGVKSLVRVERGHLVLNRCRFDAPGRVGPGGGTLVAFDARGTQPLIDRLLSTWPFDSPTDKPTCRIADSILITGGDAIVTEIGRGLLFLANSVVAGGQSAIVLNPGQVARHRFEADLVLDHCTLTSERAVFTLGPWKGNAPGPDRPWLVNTQSCAVFGGYDRPSPETVLLRVDPEGMGHGCFFFQSSLDVFEVNEFAAGIGQPLLSKRKADVRLDWTGLWGDLHARRVSGSALSGPGSGVRPVSRLRPGDVQPGDLAIDPSTLMGRRPMDLGADFNRLGISPTPRGSRG